MGSLPERSKSPRQDGISAVASTPVLGSALLAAPNEYHSLGKVILLTLTTIAEILFRSKVTEQEERVSFALAVWLDQV